MQASDSKIRALLIDLLVIVFVTLCLGVASAVEACADAREITAPIKPSPQRCVRRAAYPLPPP
jgi:hypothetical protein